VGISEIVFSVLVYLPYLWEDYLLYGLPMSQAKVFVLLLCSPTRVQESLLTLVCGMRNQNQLGS